MAGLRSANAVQHQRPRSSAPVAWARRLLPRSTWTSPDANFDLLIMNPPFTRNTTNEGQYANTFNAAFAAFEASDQDQRDMGKRMDILKTGTCYHGNAGIASAFAALAHKKLKPGGVLALILPLVAAAGSSWQGFREMLAKNYIDLTVVSIAASENRPSVVLSGYGHGGVPDHSPEV